MEDEITSVLDAEFLHAIWWEREEASSKPHRLRLDRGFHGRSNPDGTKPHTKDVSGLELLFYW